MNFSHIRFWVFAIIVTFFLSPFIRTPEQMREFVREETRVTISSLGSSWGGGVVRKSIQLFQTAPVQMGKYLFDSGTYDVEEKSKENFLYKAWSMQVMLSIGNKVMSGWGAMMYIMSIRIMIVLSWALLLAPMLIAACVDGIGQRKIKFFNYKSIRPATFSVLSLIIIPFAMAPLFYLVVPFAVSPAVLPLITSFMLLPLSLLFANSQPMFGEK
ncbi:DUF4400 domain-containing protein (plasmid) [Comamonas aquatica]|nr:DUF4400 domain-containing protein [Comamonas aquatica]